MSNINTKSGLSLNPNSLQDVYPETQHKTSQVTRRENIKSTVLTAEKPQHDAFSDSNVEREQLQKQSSLCELQICTCRTTRGSVHAQRNITDTLKHARAVTYLQNHNNSSNNDNNRLQAEAAASM
ncbi:hypothetical protein KUCAC02_033899 [Chaenocephalus aceratus]|nr:hypothetical protein KUCAC02_033899 [Chaenocephalus aceratus]